MIGLRSITVSPWSETSRRRTPWVAGWCGPRLTVISSCSSSSDSSAPVRSTTDVPMTSAEERATMSRPRAGEEPRMLAVARAVAAGCRGRGGLLLVAQALVGLAHAYHPGTSRSVLVKITGSPPIGKSRRCGQPT